MNYVGSFEISKKDYDFYKELLEIEDLNADNKGIGKKYDYIGIATIDFENGNYVTIDLASGGNNYFDNICLYDKSGKELDCSDCTYEIGNFSLFYENDIYDIKMIIKND